MHLTLNTAHKVFSPISKAYEIAKDMQSNDEDWTYKVVENPNGNDTAIIEIYDEDNEFVANV